MSGVGEGSRSIVVMKWATLIVMCLSLPLMGCGEGEAGTGGERDGVEASSTDDVKEAETVERRGDAAGTLVLNSYAVEPGQTLRLSVANEGDTKLFFGLGSDVEKREGGEWVPANEAVFGTPHPGQRTVLLIANPGETVGPRYGVMDAVDLPADLDSGRYRALKPASTQRKSEHADLMLEATFEVR